MVAEGRLLTCTAYTAATNCKVQFISFASIGRIPSAEGGDVGASVTEAGGILAKVGAKDQPE